MNLDKKNLYFFFPYRGVGGVPILFLRLAHSLSTMSKYNLFLIDYEDGYMSKNYDKNKDISLVEYNIQKNIIFQDDDIVVFQSMPLWGMPPNLMFSEKTQLIYWNLHPYNLFGYASSIGKYFKNNVLKSVATLIFRYFIYFNDRKAVKIFDENKSIFFMDGENIEQTQKWLNIKLKNKYYLPLVIDNIENIKIDYTPNQDSLSCVWIGRIGDFKVHILIYTLRKLNKIARKINKNIIFNIIGAGEYLNYLKEEVRELGNIKIVYKDYIKPKDLKDYLKKIDIGFAMGTAALDFAKYGLPTVLLDFKYEEINCDYKYDWLYNTESFTLGREIHTNMCDNDNTSLEKMLSNLSTDYKSISLKTYKYIKNNFLVEKNVKKFIDLLEKSTLRYDDLDKKYFNMNILHKFIGAKKYYHD